MAADARYTRSIWMESFESQAFPTLSEELHVDVAIVGGGITGVTLAARIADEGRSVALLEAGAMGGGTTGQSTGNLYSVISAGVDRLLYSWGRDDTRRVLESRAEAVNAIERTIHRLSIECAFRRCSLHRYASSPEGSQAIERERNALATLGIAHRTASDGAPHPAREPMLVLDGEAQFQPFEYVRGLARRSASDRCRFFENSPVLSVDEERGTVECGSGRVTARDVVLATHTPKGRFGIHMEMVTHREYAIGATLREGQYPNGIFWGHGSFWHSLRTVETPSGRHLVAVGEEHTTGQHDAAQALQRLVSFTREHYRINDVGFRWSAQNYRSPDHLPYIGQSRHSRLYVATGFGPDGLVYGALAAEIIADALLGREHRYAKLYDARRVAPVKAAKGAAAAALEAGKAMAKDRLVPRTEGTLDDVLPGSGMLVRAHGERLAAYRDPHGGLTLLSPVCPHMKCIVHWNAVERSWDCPCHGSRFDPTGRVLEGPALEGLAPRRDSPEDFSP